MVSARGLSSQEIAGVARQLGQDDATRRQAAATTLRRLGEGSLPGIEGRLVELARHRPPSAKVRSILTAFRHAVGSRRADDNVDIAPGVLKVLADARDAATVATAEPLLLLRALEHISSRRAGHSVAEVLTWDDGAWHQEGTRLRKRTGLSLLPSLIELRSHDDSWVKRWAQQGVRALGMEAPEAATGLDDPRLLGDVLLAYGNPLDFVAMPRVVRMVHDERLQVRRAARATVARFGKNAIWQLRELYAEVAGKPANKGWNAERTARELYALFDAHRDQRARERLARGMAHFVAGRLDDMRGEYDSLLAEAPEYAERAQMAPGYASLGADRLERDLLDEARDAYQRALRLSPEAEEAGHWKAQLAYIEGERALQSGVVDLERYARAQEHEPGHSAALEAYERLSGRRAETRRQRRRLAAGAAVLLLAGFAWLLRRRPEPLPSREGTTRPRAAGSS